MARKPVSFSVPGKWVPESKRTYAIPAASRYAVRRVDTARAADYKTRVAWSAKMACSKPLTGPLVLDIVFRRPKPASYRKADNWPYRRPDLENLMKSTIDGMDKIAFNDDAQIVELYGQKEFGDQWEVVVHITPIEPWPYDT